MIQEHREQASRAHPIANIQSDWTRRVAKCIIKRERMVGGSGSLKSALRHANRLIWESLQPEDMRERTPRRHRLIELEASDMRSVSGRNVLTEHALEAPSCARLIARIV